MAKNTRRALVRLHRMNDKISTLQVGLTQAQTREKHLKESIDLLEDEANKRARREELFKRPVPAIQREIFQALKSLEVMRAGVNGKADIYEDIARRHNRRAKRRGFATIPETTAKAPSRLELALTRKGSAPQE